MQIHYGKRTAEVDDAGYIVTMDLEHHKIHEGRMFHYSRDFEGSGTGSGPSNRVMFKPSATGSMVHLEWRINTDKEVLVQFFENPATSADGTAGAVYNLNRNSTNTPTCSVYTSPGLSGSPGTLLGQVRFGGTAANPNNTEPGVARRGNEWILNSSYKYLLVFVPEGADTNVSVRLAFYEDSMFHD